MNCGDWTDEIKNDGPGKKPISHVSLMLIHILAKMLNMTYRQMERTLSIQAVWLKALKLKKAPSHSRLRTFRTEMGEKSFKESFYNIRDLLYKLDLIKGNRAIADSAPILASMNFARANSKPKINIDRTMEFFTNIDVSPPVKVLSITRKSKYLPEAMIRFFMFEKLGGFVSTSQALKYLKENPDIAGVLGFKGGKIPIQATFSNFTNKHGSIPELLKLMVDGVTEFFENFEAVNDDSDIDFFFREY